LRLGIGKALDEVFHALDEGILQGVSITKQVSRQVNLRV
jgi:hypothetical protein